MNIEDTLKWLLFGISGSGAFVNIFLMYFTFKNYRISEERLQLAEELYRGLKKIEDMETKK